MRSLKYLLACVCATFLLASCGGGDEPMLSTAKIGAAAPRAAAAPTTVTPQQAAELLMDAAQIAYPGYFPGNSVSIPFGPFMVRYYADTGTYLGVVVIDGTGFTMNGIYTVGGVFGGSVSSPVPHGVVNDYLPNLTISTGGDDGGGGDNTGHTLTVTVSIPSLGTTVGPYVLQNVPAPNTQQSFCDGLAADTTFSQIAAQGQGTLTINSCSYNGSVGNIAATLDITVQTPVGPFTQHIGYTITYTYS
jgi:hypothetical protein